MPENFENTEQKTLSLEDTIGEIEIIKQNCATMGANDYEIPTLNGLIASLRAGQLDPQTALEQAHQILGSKQDYH